MRSINYIYIAIGVAGFLVIGIAAGQAWSERKIGKLESAVVEAKRSAAASQQLADDREKEANIYKEKSEYLERQIAGSSAAARRQDEKIKTQTTNTARARADVERARGVRTIDTNTDELCAKLARLGHPCG